MTRINCVPPSELHHKHLVAEYRELPRMFRMMREWAKAGRSSGIPSTYRLGTGHMTFFVDKGLYLLRRQRAIVAEMLRRGYNPQHRDVEHLAAGIPKDFMRDWNPTSEAIALNRQRIVERAPGSSKRKKPDTMSGAGPRMLTSH